MFALKLPVNLMAKFMEVTMSSTEAKRRGCCGSAM